MKTFLEKAQQIETMCENSLFITVADITLLVYYEADMNISSLKRKVQLFCGLPSSQVVRIVDVSGADVRGRTVKEAGFAPGDAVRALLE